MTKLRVITLTLNIKHIWSTMHTMHAQSRQQHEKNSDNFHRSIFIEINDKNPKAWTWKNFGKCLKRLTSLGHSCPWRAWADYFYFFYLQTPVQIIHTIIFSFFCIFSIFHQLKAKFPSLRWLNCKSNPCRVRLDWSTLNWARQCILVQSTIPINYTILN